MDLIQFFKEVVKVLKTGNVDYALAGGMIASVYRENERTTNDLDFLIFSGEKTQEVASSIIKKFKKIENKIRLNFILPDMPWFEEALKRAKFNEIDFGFGSVPCLTKEDVVISKLYSLRNDAQRFNDLDELKSIFHAGFDIDIPYICGQMQKMGLPVPDSLKSMAPKSLLLTSKRIRRQSRRNFVKNIDK